MALHGMQCPLSQVRMQLTNKLCHSHLSCVRCHVFCHLVLFGVGDTSITNVVNRRQSDNFSACRLNQMAQSLDRWSPKGLGEPDSLFPAKICTIEVRQQVTYYDTIQAYQAFSSMLSEYSKTTKTTVKLLMKMQHGDKSTSLVFLHQSHLKAEAMFDMYTFKASTSAMPRHGPFYLGYKEPWSEVP